VHRGRLRNLAGFGAKSEERLLRGLAVMTGDRVLLPVALDIAATVIAALEPLAGRVSYAGSLRRMRETIGDVDILAAAGDDGGAERLMTAFRDLAGQQPADNSTRHSVPPAGEDAARPGVVVSGPPRRPSGSARDRAARDREVPAVTEGLGQGRLGYKSGPCWSGGSGWL
jgi:hypothetical protein